MLFRSVLGTIEWKRSSPGLAAVIDYPMLALGGRDETIPDAFLKDLTALSRENVTTLGSGVYALLALSHALRRGFEGIVQPLMFSLQARAVSRDLQGAVVGLRVTNNRLSSVVTPVIMGLIVEFFGLANGFYAMGALLLLGCCALAVATARSPTLRTGEI